MSSNFSLSRATLLRLVQATVVTIGTLLMLSSALVVDAEQIPYRSIQLSNSNGGETSVTYVAEFQVPAGTGTVQGIALEFCTDPFPGTTCTAPTGFDSSSATLTEVRFDTDTDPSDGSVETGWTMDTESGTDTLLRDVNEVVIEDDATNSIGGDYVHVEVAGITNPTADNSSFYARIYTFASNATQDDYTAAPNNDGGVAMSTAEQITVEARIQETLTMCVGDTDANSANTCTDISGNDVDLGVLTPNGVNLASTDYTGSTTDNEIAHVRVSTNAFNGLNIEYVATELRVGSATCTGTNVNDQCINEQATEATLTGGTEAWGLSVLDVIDDGSIGGEELTVNGDYDEGDTATADTDNPTTRKYMVVTGAATPLASASSVVDNEQLNIDFAATANAVTPTGIYQSTLTFIATGIF